MVFVRPDGRCFLRAPADAADAPDRELFAVVDEADVNARELWKQLGFEVSRREGIYIIPTDPAVTGLREVEPPRGFLFVSADRVDEHRLRLLDDALRQDVPGTDGWRWSEDAFHEETFCDDFDPATYLVAVERATGEYVGLARVWNNPSGPRLGLIAVLAPFRRRGLARALLAPPLAVLHDRRKHEVVTEVDDMNVASVSLISGLGARRVGGAIELVRRV